MNGGMHDLTIDELDAVSGGLDFSVTFGTTMQVNQFTGVEGPVTCISVQNGGKWTSVSCTNDHPG